MPTGVYERTPEARENIRRAKLGNKNCLGRKHSAETREKMRQGALDNKRALGYRHPPETRVKIRQASLQYWADPEHRKQQRERRLCRTFPQKMTVIERLLHDGFKKRRLKFEMHKTMFGRFQPDFVFGQANLIVQADGDYWHGIPKTRSKDARFNEIAHAAGWTVWRFGEREIEMHAGICAKAVACFVRQHLK